MKKLFTVSASHVSPAYALDGATVEVHSVDKGATWFADTAAHGCGKDARDPMDAIAGLLLAHGCRDIHVVEIVEAESPARAVERLKSEDRFADAGRLAFESGLPRDYGCHYGMRSTRASAIAAFNGGYDEANAPYRAVFPDYDESWKNDACPVLRSADGYEIWCDYRDPAKRDFPETPRYSLSHGDRAITAGEEFATILGGLIRDRLAREYVTLIGYDPFADDPAITVDEVRATLAEYKAERATEPFTADNAMRFPESAWPVETVTETPVEIFSDKTIDLSPTWESILPVLMVALVDGTEEGKRMARVELQRMAKVAGMATIEPKESTWSSADFVDIVRVLSALADTINGYPERELVNGWKESARRVAAAIGESFDGESTNGN